MEDLERQDRFANRVSDWERESLVPNRASGAGVVRVSGESVVRVEVDNDVGFEIASVSPVDVFEVLRADYCDFEILSGRRRHVRVRVRGV